MRTLGRHISKQMWQVSACSPKLGQLAPAAAVSSRLFDFGYNQIEDTWDQGKNSKVIGMM